MGNLIHPRICIFHVAERKEQALQISDKYEKLGAKVFLDELKPGKKTNQFIGWLFYFDRSNKRAKQIGDIIRKDLNRIERLKLRLLDVSNDEFDFGICLARPKHKDGISLCPKCGKEIPVDRLNGHINKAHAIPNNNKPSKKRVSKGKEKTVKVKTKKLRRHLIFASDSSVDPTLLGEPKTLGWFWSTPNVRIKTLKRRMCRICNSRPIMYNSGECYHCNPK